MMCSSYRAARGISPGPSTTTSKSWVAFFSSELLIHCIIVTAIALGIQIFTQQKQELDDIVHYPDNPLRILLVGKTGVGKSATGNTILGKKVFKSEISSSSVTGQCEKFHAILNGRKVSVIDSPGLFDTSLTKEEVVNRIKRCIPLSAPGPDVFLIVIQLGRFTDEEAEAVRIIERVERVIEKEKQRILKETEEQRQREIGALRAQLEDEAYEKALKKLNEKYDQEARYQAEILPFLIQVVSFLFKALDKFLL